MKLESISLKNFRCYKEIKLILHQQMTVLVANNGHGKTACLDAIRIGLSPYISSFQLARTGFADPANTITVNDVLLLKVGKLMARQLPSEIEVTGNYGDGIKVWKRFRDSEARKSQTKDDATTKTMKTYSSKIQTLIRNVQITPVDLPVFGYYGTGRLWREKRLTQSKKGNSNKRKNDENISTFAYRDCLDPASSYKQFEEWFTSSFKKMRESQIKQIEVGDLSIQTDPAIDNPVKVIQEATNLLLKNTGWQNIAYSETHDKALVLHHPEKGILKVDQLSDGIKNMLAMVADIAYRCSLLNEHKGAEAALKSSGIVMIDEIDMHLHPSWQQTVVHGLIQAFPNIQFIITTHSPQVLSTVDSDCIRILHDGEVHSAPKGTKGAEASRLLKRVLGVDVRPPDDENTKLLNYYLDMVYSNKWSDQETQVLRQKLDDIYDNEEPTLTEADLYIENKKWELDNEEDK